MKRNALPVASLVLASLFAACSDSRRAVSDTDSPDPGSGGEGNGNPTTPTAVGVDAPSNLSAQVLSTSSIRLVWQDNSDNELGFKIERGASPFEEIAVVEAGTLTFVDSGLSIKTDYSYRVRAFSADESSEYSNTIQATTLAPEPSVAGVRPDSAFVMGGHGVRTSGSGFSEYSPGQNSVMFGGALAGDVVTLADDVLTASVPAGSPGSVDVAVVNENGSGSMSDGFTFFSYPPVFSTDSRLDQAPGVAGVAHCEVCCDGQDVYVVWQDFRNGGGDIYLNRSTDGGYTWNPSDTRLDTDVAGAANSFRPKICRQGSNVYVMWAEDRNGTSFDIYFNRSADAGATWQASDRQIDAGAQGVPTMFEPQMCADGDNIYVAWADSRGGGFDIYLNRSHDAGLTWQSQDQRLDTDPPTAGISQSPRICTEQGRVYAVWQDNRNGRNDIFFNFSEDGGRTWQGSDIRIDSDAPGAAHSMDPQICAEGSNVYVAWKDARHGRYDIYFARSIDGGRTFSSEVRLDVGDARGRMPSEEPRIACAGDNVYVVWQDGRKVKHDIYLNRSSDRGASWLAQDIRLDSGAPGKAFSLNPVISAEGEYVFVAWRDLRNRLYDVYFNSSADGGRTWLAADRRVDSDGPRPGAAKPPVMVSDGARVYIAWDDDRGGGLSGTDIYFNCTIPE